MATIIGNTLESNHVLTQEEVAELAEETGKPAETLANLVALIAHRFHTDVCSAYLLEPDRANLVLAATLGLRKQAVGVLRLSLQEGLAGLVAELARPVAVEQVKTHPRFKYFSEAGEDAYQSFLGVPLIDRGVLQGVLVVQTIEPRVYREDEIRMLVEAAAEASPVVSQARTLDRFIAPTQERLWLSRAICGGVGITIPPVSFATWIRCAGPPRIRILSRYCMRFLSPPLNAAPMS